MRQKQRDSGANRGWRGERDHRFTAGGEPVLPAAVAVILESWNWESRKQKWPAGGAGSQIGVSDFKGAEGDIG